MMSQNILVIDDDKSFIDLCRSTLCGLGHTVYSVSTDEEALQIATDNHLHLVLISSCLQGINALESFSRLRQRTPGIIGILVSDCTDVRSIVDAVNNGFNNIIEESGNADHISGVVQNALSKAQLHDENIRLKTLFPLYQLGKRFLAVSSVEEICQELVEVMHTETTAPCVSVMMYDVDSGTLKITASKGLKKDVIADVQILPGEKIAGWVFSNGKPVLLNRKTQNSTQFSPLLTRDDIAASISYPLTVRRKVTGVVNISHCDSEKEYSQADIEMLSVICDQAAMAIENLMASEERERAVRLRTLFEQFVAPEVAEYLLNKEESMLDVGEVKNLTILFADIRNFTGLVQHVAPEQLRVFLNRFFELFTDIVFSARGTLDKFMGDAALVFFGAPVPLRDPETVAVTSAIQVYQEFEKLKEEWAQKNSWFNNIGIGIGVSSGEVYLGNVGSERRLDFTVIGTNVNIAQRLASENNSGQILITEGVSRKIVGRFKTINEGSQHLRGLEQAIHVYSVLPVDQ